ncbi:DUF2530 domain-containing protein [Streptomyces sp. JJ38]|uniref:DUF2530 domain-containing protein n=1 Tax=Streptomyces sp. JJ38 TaxID=2738128 RepID=UPI001C58C43F|nr:DUF2530 domain-containing protein [Streptomyces sp. JJ38]MBW1597047.1 DUF2530 domain-containing protein [Streptomyces sp. JJ38]
MRLRTWLDDDREAPEPLEGNVVLTVAVGTAAWFVLFLAQLPFYGWFADHGHTWWLWSCLAGGGLGLVGLLYVRARDAAIRRAARPSGPEGSGPSGSPGPSGADGPEPSGPDA